MFVIEHFFYVINVFTLTKLLLTPNFLTVLQSVIFFHDSTVHVCIVVCWFKKKNKSMYENRI